MYVYIYRELKRLKALGAKAPKNEKCPIFILKGMRAKAKEREVVCVCVCVCVRNHLTLLHLTLRCPTLFFSALSYPALL